MIYEFDQNFLLDVQNGELSFRGESVPLTAKESKILSLLVQNPGRLMSAEVLIEKLYAPDEMPADPRDSIKGYVYRLRKKLGDSTKSPKYLKTEGHVGYRWICESKGILEQSSGDEKVLVEPEYAQHPLILAGLDFCGRSREWKLLRRALMQLKQDDKTNESPMDGKLFFLKGSGGMGKTHLTKVYLEECRSLGIHSLVAQCSEGEGAEALHVWSKVMIDLTEDLNEEQLKEYLRNESVEFTYWLRGLLGFSNTEEKKREAILDRSRFIWSAARFFFKMVKNEKRSLVLILEDLHRADRFSLELLYAVVSRLQDLPLIILGTFRDGKHDLSPGHLHLLSTMHKSADYSVRLEPFSKEDIESYMVMHGLSEFHQSCISEVQKLTGGLPLFLKLWVENQKFTSKRVLQDQLEKIDFTDVNPLILSLVEGLSADCISVLWVASILGPTFSIAKLQSVMDQGAEVILGAIEEAIESSILSPTDRVHHFRFNHDLLRQGLIQSMTHTQKIKYHDQISRGLSQFYESGVGSELSELAYHFVQSAPVNGQWCRAAKACERAAEYSEKILAFDEASKHYENALECLKSDPRQDIEFLFDVLLKFASALHRSSLSGNRERAFQVISDARVVAKSHGWLDRLVEATLSLAPDAMALEVGKVDDSLIEMIKETLALIERQPKTPQNISAYATLLSKLAMALYWDESTYGRRKELLDQSLELAEQSGSEVFEIQARSARHVGLWLPENLQWRLGEAQLITEKSVHVGDARLMQVSRILLLTDLFESGELMKSFEIIQQYKKLSEKMQETQFLWISTLYEGVGSHLIGDLDGMERVGVFCGEIWEQVQDANAHQCMWVNYLISRYERSMVGDVLHETDVFIDSGQYRTAPAWKCFKALLATQSEQKHLAEDILSGFYQDDFKALPKDMMWPWAMMCLGMACFSLNRDVSAKKIFDLLKPLSGRWTVAGYTGGTAGPIDHALGQLCMLLNRLSEAERYFQKALLSAEQAGALLFVADIKADYAALLLKIDTAVSRKKAVTLLHENQICLKPSWRRIQRKVFSCFEDLRMTPVLADMDCAFSLEADR